MSEIEKIKDALQILKNAYLLDIDFKDMYPNEQKVFKQLVQYCKEVVDTKKDVLEE